MFLTPGRNNTIMLIRYFFSNCQPNARSFILLMGVQPLEDRKYLIEVRFIKTNTIVCDRYPAILAFCVRQTVKCFIPYLQLVYL